MLREHFELEFSAEVQREIVWALGRMGDPAALPTLRLAIQSDDPEIRGNAAEALASTDSEAAPEISKLLRDPHPDVRLAAALTFTRHPELEAGNDLVGALETERTERDERLRWAVFKAISQRPSLAARHRKALIRGVLDRNHLVGVYALEVLPLLPGTEGFDEAVVLAQDTGRWRLPRLAARRALKRWHSRGDLPTSLQEVVERVLKTPPPRLPPLVSPTLWPPPNTDDADPTDRGDRDADADETGTVALRRRYHLVVDVAGKGQMAIELFGDVAYHHAAAIVERVRGDLYRECRPVRADAFWGLEVEPHDSPSETTGSPLPPEIHRFSIRAGTVLEPPERPGAGRFVIAAVPMPELEGRANVIGRVVLGVRLLEHIGTEDVLSISAE